MVNKVEKMKVIGAFFSINENIEKINSDVVETRIISKLWGMKGTLFSRVYYVNSIWWPRTTHWVTVYVLPSHVHIMIMISQLSVSRNKVYFLQLQNVLITSSVIKKHYHSLHFLSVPGCNANLCLLKTRSTELSCHMISWYSAEIWTTAGRTQNMVSKLHWFCVIANLP